ncbi:MAG: hypothetical protein RIQ81_1126 [Pseudomonadota bacterium]
MISLKSVKKTFGSHPGEVRVLKGVTFSVAPGERVSILGPGGCGKSTVLKIAVGLLEPDRNDKGNIPEGAVTLGNVDMFNGPDADRERVLRQVGMAFQQGALFDFMTVRENLVFAMENMTSMNPADMERVLKGLLAGVKLGHTENLFPYELSGGMQRRVGIARALATSPSIAIFDEPTAGLDPVTSTIILNMIHELGSAGDQARTLLVATSNVEIAIRFAERVVIINDGAVVADGHWHDLLMKGDDWVRHFLSVRLIGLDLDYARGLNLPKPFLAAHWEASST